MKSLHKFTSILLLFIIAMCGCEKNPAAPDPIEKLHVSAFLWGNKTLRKERAIFLSYTGAVDKFYDVNDHAVSDAKVTIKHIESNEIYELVHDDQNAGNWYNETLVPIPKNTYHLRVETDKDTVIAMTKIPPALIIHSELKIFAYDQPDTNFEVHTNLSKRKPILLECDEPEVVVLEDAFCHERWEDAKYVEKMFGQEGPNSRNDYDQGINREPRHIIDGGRLVDYEVDAQTGYFIQDWYSAMIFFYRTTTVQIIALDDNYHNYVFSDVKEWTSGIVGGVGVFGSVTGEKFIFEISE